LNPWTPFSNPSSVAGCCGGWTKLEKNRIK
jgi:hypothetical protein